ncbi:MAG TPA: sporulation protein [Acidimicrobiia bacterium]|nr:sporulation protein [Acidimicrobiia bacterium]
MEVREILEQARDAVTVRRVYGKPIERGDVTVIPAAAVQGGGGGTGNATNGGGGDPGSGSGVGWGLRARPVGAYVVRDGKVRWQPALDLNRVIVGGQVVAVVALVTLRTWLKSRR